MAKVNPIQVYARPLGWIQYVCPNCGALNAARRVSWRKARTECSYCSRRYRIGMGFRRTITALPPYNAEYFGRWTGSAANRLAGDCGAQAIGRLSGSVEWTCPDCGVAQTTTLDRAGGLCCTGCGVQYFTQLLMYKATGGASVVCPSDWSPLRSYFGNYAPTQDPDNPIAPEETGTQS